jgi:hypothetical protein
MSRRGQAEIEISAGDHSGHSVVPFLLGTAVGGLAGAVVGTLLSGHATHLMATLLDVIDRRDESLKRRPNFEYMVQ